MRCIKIVPLAALAYAALVPVADLSAAPFTPGNLAVYRTLSVSSGATPVFIDEFSPVGQLVQSIPVPTVTVGAHRRLVADPVRTFEGLITRSTDGRFLAFGGYDAPVGATGVSGQPSSAVNRVVAKMDALGNIDTTTALTDWADLNSPRGVVTPDGVNFYVAGGSGGVRYTTLGSATSIRLSDDINGVRGVNIFGSQLYASNGVNGYSGVVAVGQGTPTTAGQTMVNLPGVAGGFPVSGLPGTVQFFFANLDPGTAGLDTLYVAGHGTDKLTKYSLDGNMWMSNGTVGGGTTDEYHGLTASVAGSSVVLYATRARGAVSELVTLTDGSGYGGAFEGSPSVLAIADPNNSFLGVAPNPVVPEPSTVGMVGMAAFFVVARHGLGSVRSRRH